jgi:putative transposase
VVSVQERLERTRYACGRGVPQRRACALMQVARSGLRYTLKLPTKDGPIVNSMRHYSQLYPRFGARRVRIFLARDGIRVGRDRAARIWAQAGLQVPAKRPRKRVRGIARQALAPMSPNDVWAYDFVFDGCGNGQKLKCLTLIDEYTKESLHIDVAGSIRSRRVVEVLEEVIQKRGHPKVLRSDNGPEFVSTALLKWAADRGLQNMLIEPGKPWQNGTNESFNGKFRDECLAMNWFHSRQHAKVLIEQWRKHYNGIRPHSSLGYQTPDEFASGWAEKSTTEAKISS